MDQVDIFAPAPMADGGVVGGLNNLRQMSGDMVEALNTVVYGNGQGMGGIQGGGFGGGMSSGGGFGGGQMPAPLPPIASSAPTVGTSTPLSLSDMSALGMRTPQYMPMDPDGDGMDQFGRPMESQLTSEQLEAFKGLRSSAADQGSAFGAGSMGSPFARLAGWFIFVMEDGGAVKMAGGQRMSLMLSW